MHLNLGQQPKLLQYSVKMELLITKSQNFLHSSQSNSKMNSIHLIVPESIATTVA